MCALIEPRLLTWQWETVVGSSQRSQEILDDEDFYVHSVSMSEVPDGFLIYTTGDWVRLEVSPEVVSSEISVNNTTSY